MSKVSLSDICRRVAKLRLELAGPRGKSAFAKQLGLPLSTYVYYESSRIPPADVLVAIADLAGVDIRWLLTGQLEAGSGVIGSHPAVQRAAQLLGDHPDSAEALLAFLDVLGEVMKFPQASPGEASRDGINEDKPAAKSPALSESAEIVADSDLPPEAPHAEVASQPKADAADPSKQWIPLLGRSAAGVLHFWSCGTDVEGLTDLMQLAARRASRSAHQSRPAISVADIPAGDSTVQIITLAEADADNISQFVCAPLVRSRYPDAFAVQIDGESMAPDIGHGDLVIISPSVPAVDGQAAVVQLVGQIGVTCKLYRRDGDSVHLVPINERFEPATVDSGDVSWALRVLMRIRIT